MLINPNIRRELGQDRVRELIRGAERARLARSARAARHARAPADGVVIREAVQADAPALARLADLEGKPALTGRVVVGSVRGAIRAAVGLDGRTLGDPFAPTAELVALLRLRVGQLCGRSPRVMRPGGVAGVRRR